MVTNGLRVVIVVGPAQGKLRVVGRKYMAYGEPFLNKGAPDKYSIIYSLFNGFLQFSSSIFAPFEPNIFMRLLFE